MWLQVPLLLQTPPWCRFAHHSKAQQHITGACKLPRKQALADGCLTAAQSSSPPAESAPVSFCTPQPGSAAVDRACEPRVKQAPARNRLTAACCCATYCPGKHMRATSGSSPLADSAPLLFCTPQPGLAQQCVSCVTSAGHLNAEGGTVARWRAAADVFPLIPVQPKLALAASTALAGRRRLQCSPAQLTRSQAPV